MEYPKCYDIHPSEGLYCISTVIISKNTCGFLGFLTISVVPESCSEVLNPLFKTFSIPSLCYIQVFCLITVEHAIALLS